MIPTTHHRSGLAILNHILTSPMKCASAGSRTPIPNT